MKAKTTKTAKTKQTAGDKATAPEGLTSNAVKVLEALSKAGDKEMTRAELAEKTGIPKGWSKLLGSATKGKISEDSLEGRGFIKSSKAEGSRSLTYAITAAGRKAIAPAK